MTLAQILYVILATPTVVGILAVYYRECLRTPRS